MWELKTIGRFEFFGNFVHYRVSKEVSKNAVLASRNA